jgi:hypothetical protein
MHVILVEGGNGGSNGGGVGWGGVVGEAKVGQLLLLPFTA